MDVVGHDYKGVKLHAIFVALFLKDFY